MFPKEFIVEDGIVYYRKKPLHKQPLFWTTVAGAVLSLILGVVTVFSVITLSASQVFSELDTYGDSYYDTSETYGGSYDTYTEYQVGDTVSLYSDVDVTVLSMVKDESIELVDTYYTSALVATVKLTNTSDYDYYLDEYAFGLIDPTYETYFYLDYRTYDVNIPEKIKPGETVELELIYGVDSETNFSLTFEDVAWNQTFAGSL